MTEVTFKVLEILNKRKLVNTILYADDHILMATSEDDL